MELLRILFDPLSHNTFIERSVQFEEQLMEETEFAKGECSHPPLQYDVSYDFIYDIFYIAEDDDSYHVSPICPKWDGKTIETVWDLAINPLYPRKTISQFHTTFSACEVNLSEK